MAKSLVIVESPAKARTIGKYLGAAYVVEASMGHIRDLPRSKLGVSLDDEFTPEYVIASDKKKIVSKLKKVAKGKDHIFLAADPDREGEAICWHLAWILEDSKIPKKKIKRVTFNEITQGAVRDAFTHPRSIDIGLVNAQQARRILDRIVGYKLSPLLWKKIARGLSAGRVQSVALRLIIEREREIKSFQSKEYWSLEAEFESQKDEEKGKIFKARLDKIKGEKIDLGTKDEVDAIVNALSDATYRVVNIDEKKRSRKPQPPFITSKLQQDAYTKLRFPAQKTMRIAQILYEGKDIGKEGSMGLITYMRTDSVSVSKTALANVREFIKDTYGEEYLSPKPNMYKSHKRAQEAHEAIRPTDTAHTPESIKQYLTTDEFKLYKLIWERFVASQMSKSEDLLLTIEIDAQDTYLFKTTETRNVFPGFLKVYQESIEAEDDKEEDQKKQYVLPHLTVGECVKLIELLSEQHFTKPPARFNDASLVRTLEELGIGRPSTYAPTIQTIIARSYVERKSSALFPTEMGELVINLLLNHFSYLIDVDFTAHMEADLDFVEEGKKEWTKVLQEFSKPFFDKLKEAEEQLKSVKKATIKTEHTCDVCGKSMVIKWGRFGKFLACEGFPACKYTRSIPTGYLCPVEGCGGELVKRQSKRRRIFYGCSNYPKCTHISNALPKKDTHDDEEKAPESGA